MDPYILDLTKMLLALDDEETVQKNFLSCCYALSAMRDLAPGQALVELVEEMPDYDDWFEEYLPQLEDR